MNHPILWNMLAIVFAVPLLLGVSGFLPFQLLIVVVVITTFFYRLRIGLAWAGFGGVIADGFTATGYGVLAISLLLTALFIDWLLQTWFPARSILSGVLVGGMGTLLFEMISRVSTVMLSTVKFIPQEPVFSAPSLLGALYNIVGCMVAIGCLIFIIRKTSHRFHGAFLIRG